jgi:hypothetical protein
LGAIGSASFGIAFYVNQMRVYEYMLLLEWKDSIIAEEIAMKE